MSTLWYFFKKARIAVFALSTLISLALAIAFAALLGREWQAYNVNQRIIVIILLVINGVTTVLLYLMIVVRFRLWLEAARISLVLFFQLGGTITFALSGPTFPCNNLGSESNCRRVESATVIVGWVLSAILIVYAFFLAVMSYIPPPPPPPNPEAALTEKGNKSGRSSVSSVHSDTRLLSRQVNGKRQSVDSNESFIQAYVPSLKSPASTVRTLSVLSRREALLNERYGAFRSGTPFSMNYSASNFSMHSLSPSFSSVDRSGASTPMSFRPYVGQHSASYPSRPPPPGLEIPPRPLPNPFTDPVPRIGSPMSIASVRTTRSDGYPYTYRNLAYLNHYRTRSLTNVIEHGGHWSGDTPATPMVLRPAGNGSVPRQHTISPYSMRSMAVSVHNGASRSTTPLSTGLSQYQNPSHGLPSVDVGGINQQVDARQWRQNVLDAADRP